MLPLVARNDGIKEFNAFVLIYLVSLFFHLVFNSFPHLQKFFFGEYPLLQRTA
jgi:hypothetical protein